MDAATYKKLDRCMKAYQRRFACGPDTFELKAQMAGGGYAYITNTATGHRARFDVSAWRVRFVEVVNHGDDNTGTAHAEFFNS